MEDKFDIINNKKFTSFLIKNINSIWGSSKGNDNMFPGARPVSLERKNFEKLKKYDYYIGPRTRGDRCILYFLNDKNGKNQSVFINRNLQVFNANISADDSIYYGTIFDGELYINEDEIKFSIHDSPIICSNRINKNHFHDRLDEIKCCVENTIDVSNTVKIDVKKFFPMTDINSFKNYYQDSDTQGMVFIPESLPVISGTQYSMFIWGPVDGHSFDFQMIENEDDITVKVFNLGEMINFASIDYSSDEGKIFIDSLKNLDNYKSGSIVRCSFNKVFIPSKVMCDKTHPNSLRTVERTLFNIYENIIFEEFE